MAFDNNDLLNMGNYYNKTNKTDMIEYPYTPPIPPNKLPVINPEKMRQLRNLKFLSDLNDELEKNLQPEFGFDILKNQKYLDDLIDLNGKILFFDLDDDIYNINTKMLACSQITDNIDDPKFKEYLRLRKNLNKIKIKMEKTPDYCSKSYSITSIITIIKKLDSYLIPYLNLITLAGSASNSINYLLRHDKNKPKEPVNKRKRK